MYLCKINNYLELFLANGFKLFIFIKPIKNWVYNYNKIEFAPHTL